MSSALSLAAAAVAAAVCAAVLKKRAPEIGMVLIIAAAAMILGQAVGSVGEVVGFLDELADTAGLSPAVLTPVFKTVGIALVSHSAAEVCRDAQEGGLASAVETAGAALALAAVLPLLKTVLGMITGLI